ncbi:MAG: AAA family ATPase [Clostridia bacterium]|nr:AAA family ATPase [Clostridia bacterium]
MIWLRKLTRRSDGGGYPMSAPVIQRLDALAFTAPVTFLTGENGCGKTTLIELLSELSHAIRIDGNAAPGEKQQMIRGATPHFRVEMARRPARCFYFHAEGFIRYTDEVYAMRAEAQRDLDDLYENQRYGSDYARSLASQPYAGALDQMRRMYEHDITARSHGESFLDFFGGRLAPNGLYLLDEPEAALSFFNQYVLLNMIRDAAAQNCQFVISTHSPVLTALPGADIRQIEDGQISPITYDGLPGVSFLRDFLTAPQRYLRTREE